MRRGTGESGTEDGLGFFGDERSWKEGKKAKKGRVALATYRRGRRQERLKGRKENKD